MRSSFSGWRGKGVRLKRRYPVAALRSTRRIRRRLPQKRGAGTLLFDRHRLACSVQPANAADRREPQTGSRGFRGAPIRCVHPAALRGSPSIVLWNPVACAPWNRRPGRRRFPGRQALARGRLDFSSTVGVREPAFSKGLQRLSQARRPALPESQGRQPANRGRPNGNARAELRLPGRVFETCGNDVDRETVPGGRGRLGVKGGVDVGADDGSRRTRAPLSDKPRGAANENWMFREE